MAWPASCRGGSRWQPAIRIPPRWTLEARRAALIQAKEDFTITHLADLLVRHEAYCAGREGHDRISPGVRFGIWWVAFTAGRRAATVQLLRSDLLEQDPFGEDGWGEVYIVDLGGEAYKIVPKDPVAQWTRYGQGWPGTLGTPDFGLSADPVTGKPAI